MSGFRARCTVCKKKKKKKKYKPDKYGCILPVTTAKFVCGDSDYVWDSAIGDTWISFNTEIVKQLFDSR